MKKVFVTGASGLLGANVIIKLLKDGYSVIALVRKKSSYLGKKDENLELVEGDLSADISLFLYQVDCFIHIAAETRQDLLSYKEYQKVNCDSVADLFTQAEACGVRKFLFISSANTMGYGSDDKPGNERKPQAYPFTRSLYAQSKLEAENYLLKQHKNTEVVILNPTFMIGPYDNKPSSGKLIFWAWKKRVVFYPKGGKNFVHVEDAADGVVKAIEKGKNGEKYLLAGENLSFKDFFKKINIITNQTPVMIPIPDSILNFFGRIGDGLRMLNIKTNLCTSNMKALQVRNYYSNQKSVEELNMHYQSTDRAIEDAIDYFKSKKPLI
ncbi:dihydroflavonol 4-reductase [Chryseobacterium lactis]|uniref:Dihydroflavonol 4-reductase n=1 Tax=Chryseobacterium lactis TaxID=1241981 RepID=A0A3G6RKE0_CHRLC|nr:NAD-dependent epimerase/dehydratase family protein [Chryseobacterium lactis]AZA83977.1 NAD-dependent epimerase/dehydratase family protein [Chryseobacterium lactis]AZB04363.1 NAD-dependent epimerase/dehydratase family protein [Chryseobacterium lactis]PNW12534.1 dihydroflavonol 4-reductase [Chryseobacterium lactis]